MASTTVTVSTSNGVAHMDLSNEIAKAAKRAYHASGDQAFNMFKKRLTYALSLNFNLEEEGEEALKLTDEEVLLCLRFLAGDFKKPKGRGRKAKKQTAKQIADDSGLENDEEGEELIDLLGKPTSSSKKRVRASNYEIASNLLFPGVGKPSPVEVGSMVSATAKTVALHVRIIHAMFEPCRRDVDKRFHAAEESEYFDSDAVEDAILKWESRADSVEHVSSSWEDAALAAFNGNNIGEFQEVFEAVEEMDCL